jgi:hypothetical protein
MWLSPPLYTNTVKIDNIVFIKKCNLNTIIINVNKDTGIALLVSAVFTVLVISVVSVIAFFELTYELH